MVVMACAPLGGCGVARPLLSGIGEAIEGLWRKIVDNAGERAVREFGEEAVSVPPPVQKLDRAVEREVAGSNAWVELAERGNGPYGSDVDIAVEQITKDLPGTVASSLEPRFTQADLNEAVQAVLVEKAKSAAKQAPAKFELDLAAGKFKWLEKKKIGSVEVSVGQIDIKKIGTAIGAGAWACIEVARADGPRGYSFGTLQDCTQKAVWAVRALGDTKSVGQIPTPQG